MQHPILSILLLVLLLKTPCTRILHPGDRICHGLAPSLSNPIVNFPKFTIDFYWFVRFCQVAYIKGLRRFSLRRSSGPSALRSFGAKNVLPLNIWSIRYFWLYRTGGQDVGDPKRLICLKTQNLKTRNPKICGNQLKSAEICQNLPKSDKIWQNQPKWAEIFRSD